MKSICTSIDCSVYVYGASAETCPGCGEQGLSLTENQERAFLRLFRSIAQD